MIGLSCTTKTDFQWLGPCLYGDALGLMQKSWEQVKQNPEQMIFLGCEHPSVITLGKRASIQDVMTNDIPVVQTDRGGQATLHSEGQLVIYPIVHLRHHGWALTDFIETLLNSTEKLLKTWDISTKRVEPAGLATASGKIAFMGLRVDQGITRHGLSINVSNDLWLFEGIVPCGMKGASLDKAGPYLAEIPALETAFRDWQAQFHLVLSSK